MAKLIMVKRKVSARIIKGGRTARNVSALSTSKIIKKKPASKSRAQSRSTKKLKNMPKKQKMERRQQTNDKDRDGSIVESESESEIIDTRSRKYDGAEKPNKRGGKGKGKQVSVVGRQQGQSDQIYSCHKVLNKCCLYCNNRLVFEAVKQNDNKLLRQLLSNNEDITDPFQQISVEGEGQMFDSLMLAEQNNNLEAVKLFIKEIEGKNARKSLPETLMQRSRYGSQGNLNFNIRIAPIQQARGSKEGNDAFLKERSRDMYSTAAEVVASKIHHISFLREYLKLDVKGAAVHDNYSQYQVMLTEYVRKGMLTEALYLARYDQEYQKSDLNRLYVGALSGDLPKPIVRISITKQSHIHRMLSPLHCACINPNPEILKTLLKLMPNFSLPDKNRRNLIHYAAANVNSDVLQFLLKNGSDPNEADATRNTALMIACQLGRIQNVEVIINHFENKKQKRIEEQKNSKRKLKHKNKGRKRQQQQESEEENEEEEAGDDDQLDVNNIDIKNRRSRTALHFACFNGYLNCVNALIEAGANIELKNSQFMTPISLASQNGHLNIVKRLVELGVDLEGRINKQRKTPLIFACMNGHIDIVEYLVKHGLDINKADTSGNTPLHYAAAYGWQDLVQFLLDNGANPTLKNLWNTSAASVAMQKGHFLILDILLKTIKVESADLVQDAQGRDLICQHILAFDLGTLDHIKHIAQKTKIDPQQRDQLGLSAFHYLCGVDINSVAETIVNSMDFEPKKASKSKKDDDDSDSKMESEDEEEKDEEADDDNDDKEAEKEENSSDSEQSSDVEDEKDKSDIGKHDKAMDSDGSSSSDGSDEASREQRKAQKNIVKQLTKHILDVANLLLKWGYGYQDVSNEGETPLTLAAQCQNLPMFEWLIQRKPNLATHQGSTSKRTFLHWFCRWVVSSLDKDFDCDGLIDKVYNVYHKLLKQQANLYDARGFTPLLAALSKAHFDSCQKETSKRSIDRVIAVITLMERLGHEFQEIVSTNRNFTADMFPSSEEDEIVYFVGEGWSSR